MEILNRRENLFTAAVPPEIVDASAVVKKTDYATASKAGVVKIGNNIDVSSGKISVPAASDTTAGVVKVGNNLSVDEDGFLNATGGGGGFDVDTIYDGDGSNIVFTFPEGKSISDYHFLVLATYYATSGGGHDVITTILPAVLVAATGGVSTSLWYNASWNSQYTVTGTGATKTGATGSYVINKVYAF